MQRTSIFFLIFLLTFSVMLVGVESEYSRVERVNVRFGPEIESSRERPAESYDHSEPFEFEYDDGYPRLRLTYYAMNECEGLRIQALHACSLESAEFYIMGTGSLDVHVWAVDSLRWPTTTELMTPVREYIDSSLYGGWYEIEFPNPVYLPPFGECVVGREVLEYDPPVLYLSDMEDVEQRSYLYDPGAHAWLQPNYADSLGNRWLVTYLIRAYGTYYNVPDDYYFREDSLSTSGGEMGFALCDFDRDGDQDLATGSKIIRNESGVYGTPVSAGMTGVGYPYWGDFDMDGDPDIFLASGINMDKLYANSGSGIFHDVTDPAGDMANPYYTDAVAWIDFDRDGDLDLYVANTSFFDDTDSTMIYYPDLFYRNEGAYFSEITNSVGMSVVFAAPYHGSGVALGDWNNDGWQDIFVSNHLGAPNYLWQNMGSGVFTEMAYAYGVDGYNEGGGVYGASGGACFGDIDNDGDLDLFVANESPKNSSAGSDGSALYINEGGPYFYMIDESESRGIDYYPIQSVPTFADYDNDGWLDLLISGASPGNYAFLYHNNGDGTFEDLTEDCGIFINGGGCHAWSDIDMDGDLDIVASSDSIYRVYYNQYAIVTGTSNNWVRFRCEGSDGNKLSIGTRITVVASGLRQIREIGTQYGSAGSQSEPIAHFGLGGCSIIDTVIVRWNSGTVETLINVYPDSTYHLLEGTHDIEEGLLPGKMDINVYPNPFNSACVIDINFGSETKSSIEIFDITGKKVDELKIVPESASIVTWHPDNEIPSGVYLIKTVNGNEKLARKIMLIR